MTQHAQGRDLALEGSQRRRGAVARAVIDNDDLMTCRGHQPAGAIAAAISRARGATFSASSLTGTTTDTVMVSISPRLGLSRDGPYTGPGPPEAHRGGYRSGASVPREEGGKKTWLKPMQPTPWPQRAEPPKPPRSRFLTWLARRPYAVLALLCLLLWTPGILSLPALDRDESRFAESSRQMLDSGNVIDIRFGQVPRYKKPVGIYWAQAAATGIAGHVYGWPGDHARIWTYRLPSLLGGIAAVWLTFWVAAPLGAEAGLLASLLMAASILLTAEATIATTDAVLLASVLGTQGVLLRLYQGPISRRMALWGWAAMALGILGQGSGGAGRRGCHHPGAGGLEFPSAALAEFRLAERLRAPARAGAAAGHRAALADRHRHPDPWRFFPPVAGRRFCRQGGGRAGEPWRAARLLSAGCRR